MSNPRPIHTLHRELRSTPHETEPSGSFEDQSFMGRSEEDVEDDFYRRLGSRRESSGGGNFWRSTSETQSPLLITNKRKDSSGLLGATLQAAVLTTPPTPAAAEDKNTTANHHHNNNNNHHSTRDPNQKKKGAKQRAADRRRKLDAQSSDVDVGHILVVPHDDQEDEYDRQQEYDTVPAFANLCHDTTLERSSSDQSTGSLFVKSTSTTSVLGKSSSLIFPTGIETKQTLHEPDSSKRRKINLLLDQCEAIRFPFKKKLMLNNMSLTAADIPLTDLCGTSLGNSLHKLSLAGNRLGTVPAQLVVSLPFLKHLDLSQCELHQLPPKWNLPKLARLNLSHNRLTDFPEEGMLEGLPELVELNMYGNKVAEIIVPTNTMLLSKLDSLNLGYNDLAYLPDELDQFTSLKVLKVMNNFLEKIPMRVCDMDLRTIDVSSNPVIQPPIETCERGICSMKRYYHCLRMEEQSKQKALEEVQRKVQKQKRKDPKKKGYGAFSGGFLKSAIPKSSSMGTVLQPRKSSEGSQQSSIASGASSNGSFKPESVSSSLPKPTSVASPFAATPPRNLHTASGGQLDVPPDMEESIKSSLNSVTSADSRAMFPLTESETVSALDEVTVNDTLKVIFVGMAMVGKTSMIKRLIEGRDAIIPTHDERTVGVDIYEWDPRNDMRFKDIDSRLVIQDKELAQTCGDVNIKFSVWDFAGQHVYHATHELFFSSRALYVLVWDMGATNRETHRRKPPSCEESGAFKLTYDSSDDEQEKGDEREDSAFSHEEECRRADRALEHDIDEKIQFWVDCIQSSAPGAAILPVASFSDYFNDSGCDAEAKRRCLMLKQRLLKHEKRRIVGIKERLKEFHEQNRANDLAAIRLRKLLCDYTRPKLILGDDLDPIVRVSGTQYTGFHELTSKIISIATGQDKGQWRYPIFHGHVGARIPRMRLVVREAVRAMRDRFKVVEWGYFINQLRDIGLTSVEDISDALHFLTNIGELSYFGGVMSDNSILDNPLQKNVRRVSVTASMDASPIYSSEAAAIVAETYDDDYDEDDEDELDEDDAILSLEDTSITAPSTDDGSLSSLEDFMSTGLSQFVFLNPRWLVAAVACILRHDLDREIKETRRLLATSAGGEGRLAHAGSFYEAYLNCPVITAEDACMLWQAKRITRKAADRAQEYSNNMTVTPFEFLQLLLIRFGVFVPIDLSIEKAFLGGKEYSNLPADSTSLEPTSDRLTIVPSSESGKFFFLPSLLGPCEPADAWTYKSSDSWKVTLCHSVLFPDGVPPGLMERLSASVLSSIYAVAHRGEDAISTEFHGTRMPSYEGRLTVKEVFCWRTAFFLKLGTRTQTVDGTKESIVELFTHIADRDSHLCVGSNYMGVGMRRLIVSGRGQIGDGGRKIWKGGYLLVLKCIVRAMEMYGGLEYEGQAFCPECLAKKAVSEASSWEFTTIRSAVVNSEASLRCQHGHRVDTRLVAGPHDALSKNRSEPYSHESVDPAPVVPVQDLLRAVVVVGLWDGKTQKVVRVGSGFIVDRKRGLIVTAAHTLINIWGDKNYPFGEDYYGLPQGKVVIGVIPKEKDPEGKTVAKDKAVFRYFAKIVAKDSNLEKGECRVDACVLRITTRMENDVAGNGEGCGDQPEKLLLNNPRALKSEQLESLKKTEKCELDEQVRILGYNQSGEGLLAPGESLNRFVDFARGYVCMKFAQDTEAVSLRDRFKPREEIVVICPTIGGHSGGPCVNQQGEVIGILSRADPAESQRCYISPTYEWSGLVKQAKTTY